MANSQRRYRRVYTRDEGSARRYSRTSSFIPKAARCLSEAVCRRRKAAKSNLCRQPALTCCPLSPWVFDLRRTRAMAQISWISFQREARAERVCPKQHTFRAGVRQFAADFRFVGASRIEAAQTRSGRAGLETFLIGNYRHHFAHRFHLRGQAVVCGGEFYKRETRDFSHYIVRWKARTTQARPPVMSLRNSSA